MCVAGVGSLAPREILRMGRLVSSRACPDRVN